MRKKTVYGSRNQTVLRLLANLSIVAIVLVFVACSERPTTSLRVVGTTEVGVILKSTGLPISPKTFDIVSSEQREDALNDDRVLAENKLGHTIASLGNPAETGFWLKTPLVDRITRGSVIHENSGASVNLILLPLESSGTGSQMSLSAMRALGLALTDLPKLTVFAG